jgi:hypothetical protein
VCYLIKTRGYIEGHIQNWHQCCSRPCFGKRPELPSTHLSTKAYDHKLIDILLLNNLLQIFDSYICIWDIADDICSQFFEDYCHSLMIILTQFCQDCLFEMYLCVIVSIHVGFQACLLHSHDNNIELGRGVWRHVKGWWSWSRSTYIIMSL